MKKFYKMKLSNYWDTHNQELDTKIRNGESLDSFPVDELNDLAECYRDGCCGIQQDMEMAKKLYYHIMQKGHREGARYSMIFALKGITPVGVIRDVATGDVVDSQYMKDGMLEEHPNMQVVEEETDIFKLSRLAAATGDPECCYNLAVQYGLMEGDENFKEAFKYYRIAALQGNVNAISRMAMYYAHGVGVEQNLILAAYWIFMKYGICENVDPDTQMEVQRTVVFLEENVDWIIKRDDGSFHIADDFNLMNEAVKEGEPDASLYFYNEEGGPELIKKSADAGFAPAQWGYSSFCDKEEDSLRYLKMASDQGFPQALAQYAESLYIKGDIEEAKKYFLKLLNFGNFKATKSLVEKAYVYLSKIYLMESNPTRALCCYKFTERGKNNMDDLLWGETAREVYGEPDEDYKSNGKIWLWGIIIIIIAAILYFIIGQFAR